MQAVILVVVLGSALAALLYDTDAETERQTGERVTAIATTVAAAPTVRTSVTDYLPGRSGDLGAVRVAAAVRRTGPPADQRRFRGGDAA